MAGLAERWRRWRAGRVVKNWPTPRTEEERRALQAYKADVLHKEADVQQASSLRRDARRLEWSAFGNYVNDFVGSARSRFKFRGNIIAVVVLFVILALLIFNNFIFAGIAAALGIVYVSFTKGTVRSYSKISAIILLALEFSIGHPQPLITLLVLWLGYFSMPTVFREDDDPGIKSEAYSRLFIGYLLSLAIYTAFGGTPFLFFIPTIDLQLPLFLMAVAFFATFPYKREPSGNVTIFVTPNTVQHFQGQFAGATSFIVLMVLSFILILTTWGIQGITAMLIFVIFWFISLFMGIAAGREGRPGVGVIMMIVALFVFSFQFTGTVGAQIFGPYWSPIYSVATTTFAPVGAGLESAGNTLADTWLLISCPTCYYQQQLLRQQAAASRVTEGGTLQAIEVNSLQAINYVEANPTIDPLIPLIGSIELENKGEFIANRIEMIMNIPVIKDPEKVRAAVPGSGFVAATEDACIFKTCTGADSQSGDRCEWNSPSLHGDIKFATFQCPAQGSWKSLNKCACFDSSGDLVSEVSCNTACDAGQTLSYKYSDWLLSVGVNYSFDYTVNVSTAVTVMNLDIFQQKLLNKEIRPEPAESKYSGGPVQLSLWVQKQPLRDSEESFARFSMINNGRGIVQPGSKLKMTLPSQFGSQPTIITAQQIACGGFSLENNNYVAECTINVPLSRTSSIPNVLVSFNYDIPNDVSEKSTILLGSMEYTYETSKLLELPVAKAPIGGSSGTSGSAS